MMEYKKMCTVHMAAWTLLLIGGLNWGLVGLFGFDLVDWLLGAWPILVRLVYVLIGVAALAMLFKNKCKPCMVGGDEKKMEEKPVEMPKPEAPAEGEGEGEGEKQG